MRLKLSTVTAAVVVAGLTAVGIASDEDGVPNDVQAASMNYMPTYQIVANTTAAPAAGISTLTVQVL